MNQTILKNIVNLRICVGFLGEVDQNSWWQSSFFSPTSKSFLSPVFSKTCLFTQYYGVKEAGTIVHDEHIGIGKDVFHLFRLPEMHEIEMHNLLGNHETLSDAQQIVRDKDSAEQFLQEYSKDIDVKQIGPVRLGDTKTISNISTWKNVAQYYANAFKSNNKTFPYFSTIE